MAAKLRRATTRLKNRELDAVTRRMSTTATMKAGLNLSLAPTKNQR